MRVCPFCEAGSPVVASCCLLCCVPFFPMFFGEYSLFPTIPVEPMCKSVALDPPRVCCICLDDISTGSQIRGCGHVFHTECIQEWFRRKRVCPLCRAGK
jgi:hypothetical protein